MTLKRRSGSRIRVAWIVALLAPWCLAACSGPLVPAEREGDQEPTAGPPPQEPGQEGVPARDPDAAVLPVHPENRRYFAKGREILYLTGSHTWTTLQDRTGAPRVDFDAYLRTLSRYGHNFARLWMWESPMTVIAGDTSRYSPLPWERSGPGTARDGGPKFDLTRFNPEYFDRLRERVTAADLRDVYVSVMLFQGWSVDDYLPRRRTWKFHPFHPENNVNGIDAGGPGDFHTLVDSAVTALQKDYVRKVVETVNPFDNVLYEISNESPERSWEWQYEMIRFVQSVEAEMPSWHPVGMTSFFEVTPETNERLFESPADWVSPGPGIDGAYRTAPPEASGQKVILLDTDHLFGVGGSAGWVWKAFTRGMQPIYMDPYRDARFGPPDFAIRRAMGETRRYAKALELARTPPTAALSSTGYALMAPGEEYVVYQPLSEPFTVTFANAGEYGVEWLDVTSGLTAAKDTTVVAAGRSVFVPPFTGPAVLHLERVDLEGGG